MATRAEALSRKEGHVGAVAFSRGVSRKFKPGRNDGEPRRGREDIKAFMTDFRKAFPDLNFWGAADLIAEGDYVVGRWEGGGTHTGQAFSDFLAGSLPANTGRKMKFTGTTVLKLKDGKILEEIGLDDGITALQQLGLIRAA